MTFARLVRYAHNGATHYGNLVESTEKGFYVQRLAGSVTAGFTKISEERILVERVI